MLTGMQLKYLNPTTWPTWTFICLYGLVGIAIVAAAYFLMMRITKFHRDNNLRSIVRPRSAARLSKIFPRQRNALDLDDLPESSPRRTRQCDLEMGLGDTRKHCCHCTCTDSAVHMSMREHNTRLQFEEWPSVDAR